MPSALSYGRGALALAAGLVVALLLGGCHRRTSPLSTSSSAQPTSVGSAPRGAASARATRALPAPSGSVALTAAERQAAVRYLRALERGRVATTNGDYAAAEAAFNDALLARPKDARALAERGYARLRAERYDDADADFAEAQGRIGDKVLGAQVWFNRGLVAERRGKEVRARDYFAFSFEANATAAARRKLAGKSSCPASVTTPEDEPVKLETLQSFAEARRQLELQAEDYEREHENPTTNEGVRGLLGIKDCTLGCGGGGPDGVWHLLWEMPSGKVAVLRAVDKGYYYRCGGPPTFTGNDAGKLLWVTIENTELVTSLCGPCDENYCPSCCVDGPWHRTDYFIEKESLRVLLRVDQTAEQSDSRKEAELTYHDGVLRLTGKGCDWKIPILGSGTGG